MDDDNFMELCKVAQLQCLSEKSKGILKTRMDFDYNGERYFECSDIKKILTNAFLMGYNCGMDKQLDKELEKNL
jgi:hypothetical protein